MEEKAKIVDDSASNFVIGSAKDIKQSFGRRHFAELIPVPASLSVNEKSNDVPAFKASPMPKFASAHAYWDQWNDFRQKSVQFTLPQTPELMKRPRNKVGVKARREALYGSNIDLQVDRQFETSTPLAPKRIKKQLASKTFVLNNVNSIGFGSAIKENGSNFLAVPRITDQCDEAYFSS